MSFNPADYGEALAPLLSGDRQRPLDEGAPQHSAEPTLRSLSVEAAFAGRRVTDPMMARCCISGVWLLFDLLDESHTISQSISTAEGSYWHGVMHRREGDYSNAKYWFRNVGDHPVFEAMAERYAGWDPYDFVDRCAAAVQSGADRAACLEEQQAEWELLFDFCYRQAIE